MTRPRDIADSINRINSSAADATAITIDSSEHVGVGTTSPIGDGIHVKVPDGGTGLVLSGTTTSTGTEARLTVVNEAGSNWHNLNIGANNTIFRAAGTERARITTDGLTFNGDTAAVNALDDYEEGTWTPSYSISGGSFNMSLQIGSYRKVGKIVMATARVRGQRVGGSGTLNLTGLPFTTNNVANLHRAVSIGFTNSWDTSPQAGFTTTNGTTISFKKNGSSNANSNLADDITEADTATSSTSSNDLILSVTYIAN